MKDKFSGPLKLRPIVVHCSLNQKSRRIKNQKFQKTQKKNERLKVELANERQIILELKAKMSDVGEVRASNMELIDQLQKAKAAIEKLSAIRDRQKTQIDVS